MLRTFNYVHGKGCWVLISKGNPKNVLLRMQNRLIRSVENQ
jgi:hypothetical protein